ncbi:hypothetical protein Landi51_08190 [Colletotrichum acutatum]
MSKTSESTRYPRQTARRFHFFDGSPQDINKWTGLETGNGTGTGAATGTSSSDPLIHMVPRLPPLGNPPLLNPLQPSRNAARQIVLRRQTEDIWRDEQTVIHSPQPFTHFLRSPAVCALHAAASQATLAQAQLAKSSCDRRQSLLLLSRRCLRHRAISLSEN